MNKIIKQQEDIDLLNAIKDGRTFSCNNSPTCRAKIVKLKGGIAVLEVVEHPESYMQEYNIKAKGEIGKQFTIPAYIAWNAIYF
jgi:hypothetical protein